jgi:hypothetical protein
LNQILAGPNTKEKFELLIFDYWGKKNSQRPEGISRRGRKPEDVPAFVEEVDDGDDDVSIIGAKISDVVEPPSVSISTTQGKHWVIRTGGTDDVGIRKKKDQVSKINMSRKVLHESFEKQKEKEKDKKETKKQKANGKRKTASSEKDQDDSNRDKQKDDGDTDTKSKPGTRTGQNVSSSATSGARPEKNALPKPKSNPDGPAKKSKNKPRVQDESDGSDTDVLCPHPADVQAETEKRTRGAKAGTATGSKAKTNSKTGLDVMASAVDMIGIYCHCSRFTSRHPISPILYK